MQRFLVTLLLVFAILSTLIFSRANGQGFHPTCENNLPFQLRTLKQVQSIDSACDLDGDGSARSRLQSAVKNNFCASGSPTRVTHNVFFRLEQRIEKRLSDMNIAWGTPTVIPNSRDMLDNVTTVGGVSLGEGSVVRYVGFVLDAHYSNVDNGENNNCTLLGKINNDLHITLGPNPATIECDGITAEISPHFRPDSWAEFDNFQIDNPVRLTGQLFFDASHKPCKPGHPEKPKRISSWEIHPVYAIDVCKNSTLGGCPAGDDSRWIPFNEWVLIPDNADPEGE